MASPSGLTSKAKGMDSFEGFVTNFVQKKRVQVEKSERAYRAVRERVSRRIREPSVSRVVRIKNSVYIVIRYLILINQSYSLFK